MGDRLFSYAGSGDCAVDTSLADLNVPVLLRSFQIEPKKSLGQNFLTESAYLQKIVQASEVSPSMDVLEIGPGLGSLTRFLARAANRVVAVELDDRLMPVLREVLNPFPNVTLVHGDILKQNPAQLMGQSQYLVVANIPYYITSALLRHLLESDAKPQRLVLTVQREVAKRICANPGDYSLLALSVQVYGSPRQMLIVPPGAFYPPPSVESTVLRVDLHPTPAVPFGLLEDFFRLAKAGFSQKRKTLRNALSSGLGWPANQAAQLLSSSGIDPMRRAETLSIPEWEQLAKIYQTLR